MFGQALRSGSLGGFAGRTGLWAYRVLGCCIGVIELIMGLTGLAGLIEVRVL